jgi:AraC-like DNA-binding protein
MLHVSAGYLNDTVREMSGAAASTHIQQRVIREAKRRILFEGSSMKEVAFSLGFSDQAHFSKYFKNISGKNFTDFKKEITS